MVDDKEFSSISKLGNKGLLLQLITCDVTEFVAMESNDVLELLEQFEKIFVEPKGLPPHRSHDHQINLKQKTSPMSVRS